MTKEEYINQYGTERIKYELKFEKVISLLKGEEKEIKAKKNEKVEDKKEKSSDKKAKSSKTTKKSEK